MESYAWRFFMSTDTAGTPVFDVEYLYGMMVGVKMCLGERVMNLSHYGLREDGHTYPLYFEIKLNRSVCYCFSVEPGGAEVELAEVKAVDGKEKLIVDEAELIQDQADLIERIVGLISLSDMTYG